LQEKSPLFTGASTGIGLAAAKRFIRDGMDRVFITSRRKGALDAAIAEIGEKTAYRQCVGVSTHGQFTLESKQRL